MIDKDRCSLSYVLQRRVLFDDLPSQSIAEALCGLCNFFFCVSCGRHCLQISKASPTITVWASTIAMRAPLRINALLLLCAGVIRSGHDA